MAKRQRDWVWFNSEMWLHDPALRACALATRGFWIDCLTWMWAGGDDFLEGDRIGLSRLTGAVSDGCFDKYLNDLEKNGVCRIIRKGDWVRIEGGKWADQRPGGRSRYIRPDVKVAVLASGKCRYCGATESLEVDHIFPFSEGGTHDPSNLQCLCLTCNRRKKVMSHREFIKRFRNA